MNILIAGHFCSNGLRPKQYLGQAEDRPSVIRRSTTIIQRHWPVGVVISPHRLRYLGERSALLSRRVTSIPPRRRDA
jgi:hypothetical protein